MTDEKKKDNKDGKEAKKIDDEQLKDVAGGGDVQLRGSGRTQTIYYFGKEDKDKEGTNVRGSEST